MDERPQSEFNMAVSYLNRLNALFYIADEAAMGLDAYQWFHSLLVLERELVTEMKQQELDDLQKEVDVIQPLISNWVRNKNRSGNSSIDQELYDRLHSFEVRLRRVMKESGLQMKMKEDFLSSFK